MKNLKYKMITLAGAALLVSCGKAQKEKSADEPGMPMQNEMHQEESTTTSGNLDDGKSGEVTFNDERIAAVYEHYMHLKSALVNTNGEEAKKAGEMLAESLAEVENNTAALAAAQTIATSEEVNEQRTAFLVLSNGMENLLSGAIASGEIYKQYCPMAFEGQGGAWLSASREVRNPYYGDKMLKCGSVRDTLK